MTGGAGQGEEVPGRRSSAALLIRVAIVLALAGAVFLVLDAGWPAAFDPARLTLAAATAFLLMLASILATGWRLAVLAGDGVRRRDGMAVNAIAQLVVLFVPSRLSEAAKPVGLNLRCDLPVAGGFAVLVVERLLDTVFLAFLAISSIAMGVGPYAEPLRSSAAALTAIAAMGLCGLLMLALRPDLLSRIAALSRFPWLQRQVQHIAVAFSRLADLRTAAWAIGLSTLSWLLSYLIFLAVIGIMGIGNLGPAAVLVVFVASTLGLVVSVAPGGLGTFEGAIVLALGAFGVPLATAMATALLMRLCLVLPVVVAAGWFLSDGSGNLGALIRRLREHGALR